MWLSLRHKCAVMLDEIYIYVNKIFELTHFLNKFKNKKKNMLI